MNPNAYGPPPTNMQQPQAFQQQPANYMANTGAGGWSNNSMQPPPPQQQQQQQQQRMYGGMPPMNSQQQQQQPLQPPPSMNQPPLNGNYQQQLATSMSSLSMNPMKQAPPMPVATPPMNAMNNANSAYPPQMPGAPMPPTSSHQSIGPGAPPTSYQNGPAMPGQQQQQQQSSSVLPPPTSSALNNNNINNNNFAPPTYTNGQASKPPTPLYPNQSSGNMNNLPPGQVIPGGVNQMTKSSASVPGLPHMPPPKSTTPQAQMPGQPPMSGQNMSGMQRQPPMPGQQSQMPGQPPMSGQQQQQQQQQQMPGQPPIPGQPQMLQQQQMPGPPPMSGQQQQMPGMPPMPGQQQQQQQMPGMPPMPGQQQPMPGMPPMPGQQQQQQQQQQMPGMPPMPGQQQPMPGMPPMPGQQQQQQQQQMPGMPPMPGQQQQMPGMPPMPGQPPRQHQPPMPGMPPMPGQNTMQSQSQPMMPGMPPMPGQAPFPGQQMPPAPISSQPGMPPPPMAGQMQSPYQVGQPGSYNLQNQPGNFPGAYNQQAPGSVYQQTPSYQQQPRRLDPDQMPNPIQVMIENQRASGGTFVTNQAGLLPPLVTTKYTVQDQGNSSPRYIRSSLYSIPATADLLKTTALPFTLIISPFARTMEGEYEPPIVNFGELGPIRCNRCKAYMSPNMQFIDAGRHFQCLMCKVKTEVPQEYFQHLDHTGARVDKYERPELVLGTYEFLATKNYCRNNVPPEIPAFIFILDVSYNTVKSGLVHLLCSQIKNILKHLPIDEGQDKSKVRVGFITYNSTVHFYNIKSTLAQPQMMIVGDIQDMFMPLLDGFLCDPEESEQIIDALMAQIPKMFVDTKETETILYPAIQAGLEALKASNCSGKLLVFNSSLPITEAPGKLKNREDRKLLGTDKEKTVLTPQCTSYNTLGQECVQHGCSVDLFLFNNTYIDVATIGQVARLTGGEVFKYTYFQADSDGKRLVEDIIKNVSRPIAFDAVMRVRTSAGIRATDFYGHFFMTNTTDVELASVDATKSIAVEIKHDDKLPTEENVYIQVALLYTSCSGQRRLRILNLALTATSTIADVFKSSDLDAMMLFFAKQACCKILELTPKQVKDNLIHRSAQILACYRKHCSSPTSSGQLILPECLKLLPLYVSCLLKNDAISGGSDMTLDDRSYVMQFVLSMDLNMSVNYLYPRFIPIHNVYPDDTDLPNPIRCTYEKMSEDGAFILENGVYLFVWLGQSLPQTFIQPLFGVQCTQQVNAERFAITGDSPLADRVRNIIETIMQERTRYMRVIGVRQNDKLESVFRHFLIEDRGTDGSASYVDFLCRMHKEIKDILS